MTKTELKKIFKNFIEDNDVEEKFLEVLNKKGKTFDQYTANLQPEYWFISFFVFPKEERKYWLELNEKWLNIYSQFKN